MLINIIAIKLAVYINNSVEKEKVGMKTFKPMMTMLSALNMPKRKAVPMP
jgi:hypothetical protein